MSNFAESVEGQTLRKLLMVAIDGKGAFRRFKTCYMTILRRANSGLHSKEARMCKRVLEWLDDLGISPEE